MKKIFFNSSMPRSGSTLLQNILGNNPQVYATPTSGLFDLLNSTKHTYSKSPMIKAQDTEQMKAAYLTLCRYGMHGFFDALTDREYAIDKSRAWLVNKNFLESVYPSPKVICMVRDLRDIVASMEKNFRKYPEKSTLPTEVNTIGERVTMWLDSKPVGTTLNNLYESFSIGTVENVLFIKFEDLTRLPQQIMDIVHEYLELKPYKYDFNNIKQVTFEDDKFHGIYGDHKINPVIKPVESSAKKILGEQICNQIYDMNRWYFEKFNYKK